MRKVKSFTRKTINRSLSLANFKVVVGPPDRELWFREIYLESFMENCDEEGKLASAKYKTSPHEEYPIAIRRRRKKL